MRITRDLDESYPVWPENFVEPAEGDLYTALEKAEQASRAAGSVDDFLQAFLPMIPSVNHFFDAVLVMTDEEKLRNNRLGMLQRISSLAKGAADLSRLEGF